ncbi:hypothetical protein ASG51_16460 [Methylobacterium sp. Leaf465]|uniref:DUF6894 family protein n=1 Tax=Methylobacterium sp. Leaf465 TaxID=1736385 RepID=UPI0006F51148|nr:hypothetical protein [Methylobacterium sp. Leaf465]KQT83728.1 hypothetical protein ASG51_16460 [Methylobacterium sp. Leaf465]
MARYFFDINDGSFRLDEDGLECADFDAVRREAKRALPAIAGEILPEDGDHLTLTVRVRNDRHETVYTATLMFNGLIVPSQE